MNGQSWVRGREGKRLRTSMHNNLLTVTLNHPPVNALDATSYSEIHQIFDSIHAATDISAVYLRADHRCFCAGQDRRDAPIHKKEVAPYLRSAAQAIVAVTVCPIPVIAAVQSAAIGAGLILASSADILVVDSTATISLPERRFGIISGFGHLERWLGAGAERAVLTGEPIPPHLLEANGALLVAHEELEDQGSKIAGMVSEGDPEFNRAIKQEWLNSRRLIADSYLTEIEQTISLEKMDFSLPMSTD
jgi:enoyl-CoA hydratase